MAAYYYVKNDGTATGDAGRYASQQTGSFATLGTANYYADIASAIAATTTPVAGDFINFSDLHSFSNASSISYVGALVSPYFVVCVDDTNIDAARTSGNRGSEATTGSVSDITIRDQYVSGMEFNSTDNFIARASNILSDCKLISGDSSGDRILSMSGDDGINLFLENCELSIDHISTVIFLTNVAVIGVMGQVRLQVITNIK